MGRRKKIDADADADTPSKKKHMAPKSPVAPDPSEPMYKLSIRPMGTMKLSISATPVLDPARAAHRQRMTRDAVALLERRCGHVMRSTATMFPGTVPQAVLDELRNSENVTVVKSSAEDTSKYEQSMLSCMELIEQEDDGSENLKHFKVPLATYVKKVMPMYEDVPATPPVSAMPPGSARGAAPTYKPSRPVYQYKP